MCIYVNKVDCDTASSKQEKFDEISNNMTSWREHPQNGVEFGGNGTND